MSFHVTCVMERLGKASKEQYGKETVRKELELIKEVQVWSGCHVSELVLMIALYKLQHTHIHAHTALAALHNN